MEKFPEAKPGEKPTGVEQSKTRPNFVKRWLEERKNKSEKPGKETKAAETKKGKEQAGEKESVKTPKGLGRAVLEFFRGPKDSTPDDKTELATNQKTPETKLAAPETTEKEPGFVSGVKRMGQTVLHIVRRTRSEAEFDQATQPGDQSIDITPLSHAEDNLAGALDDLDQATEPARNNGVVKNKHTDSPRTDSKEQSLTPLPTESVAKNTSSDGGGGSWETVFTRRETSSLNRRVESAERNAADAAALAVGALATTAVVGIIDVYRGKSLRNEQKKLQKESRKQAKELKAQEARIEKLNAKPNGYVSSTERSTFIREVATTAEKQAQITREVTREINQQKIESVKPAAVVLAATEKAPTSEAAPTPQPETETFTLPSAKPEIETTKPAAEYKTHKKPETLPEPTVTVEAADRTETNFGRSAMPSTVQKLGGAAAGAIAGVFGQNEKQTGTSTAAQTQPTVKTKQQHAHPHSQSWLYGTILFVAMVFALVFIVVISQ